LIVKERKTPPHWSAFLITLLVFPEEAAETTINYHGNTFLINDQ